jgi:hypothetical protein
MANKSRVVVQQAEIHLRQVAALLPRLARTPDPRGGTLRRSGQRRPKLGKPVSVSGGARRSAASTRGSAVDRTSATSRSVATVSRRGAFAQLAQVLALLAEHRSPTFLGGGRHGEPRRQVQAGRCNGRHTTAQGARPPGELRVPVRRCGQFGGSCRQPREQCLGAASRGSWSRSSIWRSMARSTSAPTSGLPAGRGRRPAALAAYRAAPEHSRRQDARLAQFQVAAAEHQQVRRQVAAIDRRNVYGDASGASDRVSYQLKKCPR